MVRQRITFGLHLDGQRAVQPDNALGVSVVGPLGFLSILETQLGLLGVHPAQAERIVQYRECLQEFDAEGRFYHRSFAVDPLGTAACLLGWRDEWMLHGWDGTFSDAAPGRLRDLAEIEHLALAAVAPNIGQRLIAVCQALRVRNAGIAEVSLRDPASAFPSRWRDVLATLPVVEVADEVEGARGFLGALQARLKQTMTGQAADMLAWQDDGSLMVARAETRALAAGWLATQLADVCPTLLVVTNDGMRLDTGLAAAGEPRQGLKESSPFRPSLQVLPMALALLWDPLDFDALVQFLTHPVSPVRGFARFRLAATIAQAPGTGGEKWRTALADIQKHFGEEAHQVQEQIAIWVQHPRFSMADGAPLDAVIDRVARLVDFFQRRLGEADAARRLAFFAGWNQCCACLDSLKTLRKHGESRIRPRQLQKLVSQATANGSDNPLWPAEVGAVRQINHPGAAIAAAERVVWWQLEMPVLPERDPWSASEIDALRSAGVVLPDVAGLLDRSARDWLRPLFAAKKQLVLVLPPPGEEVHPLWQVICAVVDQPRVVPLEDWLRSGGDGMRPLTPAPLPVARRWWKLPDDVTLSPRAQESFSSLELMLFNPYQWLLRYPAALSPSRIINLSGEFRLFGNLAHGLVERYYRHPAALAMGETEFNAWFDGAFGDIIDQEGALLRMPGRGADLEGFRYRLHRAMLALRKHIGEAGVVHVEPEQGVSGRFVGGALAGSADLVLTKPGGELVVVDMKWAGVKKFPEKLKTNRHLQLAIYAELLRQQTERFPSVAYFILDEARVFAPDDHAFSRAEVIPAKSGENTAQLWQRFEETWRWRIAQIRAGDIEVVLEGIPETEESKAPEHALAVETLNSAYNDYLVLAGWKR